MLEKSHRHLNRCVYTDVVNMLMSKCLRGSLPLAPAVWILTFSIYIPVTALVLDNPVFS